MSDDGPAEARVRVVYCGGCNPHIDRESVAAGLPVDDPGVPSGATVRLSGCARACASGHQLVAEGDERRTRGTPFDEAAAPLQEGPGEGAEDAPGSDGPPVVVVAGELVDGVPTPSAGLVPAVTRKLKE